MELTGLSIQNKYEAILHRDRKYDGLFLFAVTTTGIYCRPSCPAPRPRQDHVVFYQTVQEARVAGFRACKRCHPDDAVEAKSQALLATIHQGIVNEQTIATLAEDFGVSSRHFRRVVKQEMKATPSSLRNAERLKEASRLLLHTMMPITQIAFNVGFSSIRQFNRVFKKEFGCTPRQFRLIKD